MNKIWIIEDDASLARLISENLTKWGYPCEAATDFDQLDKDFLSVQPQLIIMDVSLPGKVVMPGVRKSANYPRYQFFFCPRIMKTWISSWR